MTTWMHQGTLPLGWLAAVIDQSWPMFLILVTLLLWLFLDRTLPSGRRHRPAVFATLALPTRNPALSVSCPSW